MHISASETCESRTLVSVDNSPCIKLKTLISPRGLAGRFEPTAAYGVGFSARREKLGRRYAHHGRTLLSVKSLTHGYRQVNTKHGSTGVQTGLHPKGVPGGEGGSRYRRQHQTPQCGVDGEVTTPHGRLGTHNGSGMKSLLPVNWLTSRGCLDSGIYAHLNDADCARYKGAPNEHERIRRVNQYRRHK